MCRTTVEKEQVFLTQSSAGGNNDALIKGIGGYVERLTIVTYIVLAIIGITEMYFGLRLYRNCHRAWIQQEIAMTTMQRIRSSIRGRTEDSVEVYAGMLDAPGNVLLINFVLKSRLSENAKLRISGSYKTIQELIDDLKKYLLPKKSFMAIQTQLQNIQQGSRSVEDYGFEVEKLLTELTITQADGKLDTFSVLKPINENFAINRFSAGLRRSKLSTNLKDAIQAAKDEECTSFQA
ncbi:hypothetical protein HF086_001171 [Spodoptera exigua]|uniref:Retrotransposon gag domain-containing protein n=1 Tax=Spodoptera exigua TaxID=7107 RepID=A0A922SC44_SPOEX|nr:hypothetical protein HF086_001171 [Spodoptera exigua]